MKVFEVKEGTSVITVKNGAKWSPENMRAHTTTKDHVFDLKEVNVDPFGLIKGREVAKPINATPGGDYAKLGYYGFRRSGWTMLVRATEVRLMA